MESKKYTMQGTANGSVTLKEEVFSCRAHPQTINDVVKAQRNNERQGTVYTKTRSYVLYCGQKMYRQKGTGRARAGDRKSPLRIGGGTIFGPQPRSFDHRPPKKVVDRAIKGILSEMVVKDRLRVIEDLDFAGGKTREVVTLLKNFQLPKALLVVPQITENIRRATGNLKEVKVVTPMNVNACDLLKYGHLAISDKAISTLEEILKP